jgi:decaprenylphospho-beta-D-erythro-pentofuranosid-2-ulose 2-reductase
MTKVVIFGATSAIAEACARELAGRQAEIFLLARSLPRMETLKGDLAVRGAAAVHVAGFDAGQLGSFEPLIEQAWKQLGKVDIAIIAFGTLSNQDRCSRDMDELVNEFRTNALATVVLCEKIAGRLEQQHGGTLVVISSVAGDRGRASNYAYGAAKAAVTAFASGLRQRLQGTGVNVLTVKPGFVDTPMTAQFPKGALWASPRTVAVDILRAVERRRSVLYTPWFWRLIMLVIVALPEKLFLRFGPR